jgi:DNA invertase Pin-like site-specific DNA recombinase
LSGRWPRSQASKRSFTTAAAFGRGLIPSEWIFQDEGYSGATLARPGLERLRDLAAEGQIQGVLVYAPDRLSRQYASQVLLLEEFSRQAVEMIFLKGVAAETYANVLSGTWLPSQVNHHLQYYIVIRYMSNE